MRPQYLVPFYIIIDIGLWHLSLLLDWEWVIFAPSMNFPLHWTKVLYFVLIAGITAALFGSYLKHLFLPRESDN